MRWRFKKFSRKKSEPSKSRKRLARNDCHQPLQNALSKEPPSRLLPSAPAKKPLPPIFFPFFLWPQTACPMGGGRSNKSDESTLGRAKKSGKKATTIRAGVFELLLAYQSRTYQQKGVAAFRAQIDEYARSQTTTKGGAAAVFFPPVVRLLKGPFSPFHPRAFISFAFQMRFPRKFKVTACSQPPKKAKFIRSQLWAGRNSAIIFHPSPAIKSERAPPSSSLRLQTNNNYLSLDDELIPGTAFSHLLHPQCLLICLS